MTKKEIEKILTTVNPRFADFISIREDENSQISDFTIHWRGLSDQDNDAFDFLHKCSFALSQANINHTFSFFNTLEKRGPLIHVHK